MVKEPNWAEVWTCGHNARPCCGECYRQLASASHHLAEMLDDLLSFARTVNSDEARAVVAAVELRMREAMAEQGMTQQ